MSTAHASQTPRPAVGLGRPPVPSDLAIAQAATPRPIGEIAAAAGIARDELVLHGEHMAKLRLSILERLASKPAGRLVVVTAITPTPLGEGKTTVTIGLAQALGAQRGHRAFACIRQPSMGPTFGIKGGAAGGGYSQVIPMEDFNLHLTGDTHAVAAANNLLAAAIDARMLHESKQAEDRALARSLCRAGPDGELVAPASLERRRRRLGIPAGPLETMADADLRRLVRLDLDPASITWRRVVDVNDRMLREIEIGLGPEESAPRRTGFDIAVASEIMAVLALASDLRDLRDRLRSMVVGASRSGDPVTADDIGAAGALAVLMRSAILPNLLQTLEATPVLVHAGPFANIAHGNSSVIADRIALALGDYAVTEAGFGSDIGFEKCMNIKCRSSGLRPACAVVVATVRALKMHGGGPKVVAGKPLDPAYTTERLDLLEAGLPNLRRHIANVRRYGVPAVVAINVFASDTREEIELLRRAALAAGAVAAVESRGWAEGGRGCVALAEAVESASRGGGVDPVFLYPSDASIERKIEAIAASYGAAGVDWSEEALAKRRDYERWGLGALPICMAKTHLSFSDRPEIKGAPSGFRILVRDLRASVGAGFLYPIVGAMRTMPGLPARPAFFDIDLDPETGRVEGLF